jgi:hypothetical protein
MWMTYRSAGAEVLVVVGPVRDQPEAATYERSLPGATFTWCGLEAGGEELTRRILSRREGGSWSQPGDPMSGRSPEHLLRMANQAAAEADRLDTAGIGVRIDTDGLTVDQSADRVLFHLQ